MLIDWENVTNYLETVGSSDKVFSFPKSQSAVQITNKGNANLIYTIGSQSGTLTPTQSVKVSETILNFTLRSSSGAQLFECWSTEAGTEQDETETDLNSLAASLADSASNLNGRSINVKYPPTPLVGVKGDGVTDDTIAFQNMINACSNGSIIKIPLGARILLTGTITIPASVGYLSIKSDVHFHGVADGNTYATGLIFNLPNNTVAIDANANSKRLTLIGVFLQGTGINNGCTGIKANNDVHIERCQIYDWGTGVNLLNGAWYSKTVNSDFVSCGTGVNLGAGVYNFHSYGCKFSCNIALNIGSGCKPVSVFGGSIENFTTAGVNMATNTQVNIYGVYWESSAVSGNIGIGMSSGSQLNLWGNYVYLYNLNRWVNASGLTSVSINSRGNYFASTAGGGTTPQAYVLPSSGIVDIGGDDWNEVSGTATFINSSMNVPNFRISPPMNGGYQPIQYQGNDFVLVAHTSAPVSPTKYGVYLADGATWNPLAKGTTTPYLVLWSGTAWVAIG